MDLPSAAGVRAKAFHAGSFVWGDNTDADVASTADAQFVIRARGGVRVDSGRGISLEAADRPIITRGFDVFTSGFNEGLGRWGLFMENSALVIGMPALSQRKVQVAKYQPDGSRVALATIDQAGNLFLTGSVNPTSDRNSKTNFARINHRQVLERLCALPVEEWSYSGDPEVRHIGPVSQDFHAAFAVGTDDKHIATVDADGVALAAIQGLHEMVKAKDAEIQELKSSVAELALKNQPVYASRDCLPR